MAVFWDITITLMMEVVISETSTNFYEATRRNITEDCHLHTRRRKNLICRLM
jgi:hypothetical protein